MKNRIWAIIGLGAVVFSIWLLMHELRGMSLDDFGDSLSAIPLRNWCLSALGAVAAYAALAWYDHLALMHLGRKLDWFFITLCSFTSYALAHNIGASVFSGAVVRYRAYSTKGLSASEIGILVAFCSFTFALGTVLLSGLVLIVRPDITARFGDALPMEASTSTGLLLLGLVLLYLAGSWLGFRPLRIGSFALVYPRLPVALRQLVVGPIELAAAAAIIYFALPADTNPGYIFVLGIFVISFAAALISHAPGGLGVLELLFIAGTPDVAPADVLAALFVFRLFYLIVPLVLSLLVVVVFERSQLALSQRR